MKNTVNKFLKRKLRFTCRERKIFQNIKKSQIILKMIVGSRILLQNDEKYCKQISQKET